MSALCWSVLESLIAVHHLCALPRHMHMCNVLTCVDQACDTSVTYVNQACDTGVTYVNQ